MRKQMALAAGTVLILSCSSWLPVRSNLPANTSWLTSICEQGIAYGNASELPGNFQNRYRSAATRGPASPGDSPAPARLSQLYNFHHPPPHIFVP